MAYTYYLGKIVNKTSELTTNNLDENQGKFMELFAEIIEDCESRKEERNRHDGAFHSADNYLWLQTADKWMRIGARDGDIEIEIGEPAG